MRKILIAVSPEDHCANLAARFPRDYCVKCCSDGPAALELLSEEYFDGLVLDMMLPGMDGITILRSAQHHLPPVILAVTAFTSPYMQQQAKDLGVGYMLLAPCSVNIIVTRLKDMLHHSDRKQVELIEAQALISTHLQTLGVPEKLNGYAHLRIGIPYFAQDMTQELEKELYTIIGDRCGKGAQQVERSIRVAIEAAWENRDETVWQHYFRPDRRNKDCRPTNKQFISRLAQILSDRKRIG